MDVSGLSAFLLSSGPWGAIVLYLLWDRYNLIVRLDKATASYTENLLGMIEEVTKAISASTESMRSNTSAQEKITDSSRTVAEAIKLTQLAIAALQKEVERLSREANA